MKTYLNFIKFSTGIIISQESDHDAIHAAFYKHSSCYIILLTEGVWVNLSPEIPPIEKDTSGNLPQIRTTTEINLIFIAKSLTDKVYMSKFQCLS